MKNVKKKNAVLLGLVACMLAISIANYTVFYNDDTSVSNVEDGPSNATLVSNVTEEDILSGNAELSSEFFSEYRLNRDKVRSQNLEALQNITNDTSLDKEIIKESVEESVSISKLSETELVVENLIKAKGFDDAIVIIHAGYANVIVDAASLSPSDAAQIQNIVNKECNIAISKVTIATSNNSEKQDTEEKNEDGENTNNTENSQNNS